MCSQRPSTLDELVTQHDKDMDMIEQEHEEEVKALRQEKHSLQQKLQEAELKWNHYITQQAAQVSWSILYVVKSVHVTMQLILLILYFFGHDHFSQSLVFECISRSGR